MFKSLRFQFLTNGRRWSSSDAAVRHSKRIKTGRERREHFNAHSRKVEGECQGPVTQEPRLPKKKVALYIGFNGTGYQGMQLNPTALSIEQTLFDALCKAGAVSSLNSSDPKKIQLNRAARTDKGVHAAGNIVSLKMIVEDPDIVSKINAHLPEQIRVWGYTHVMGSFHAKNSCNARVYEYWLPTYALMPPAPAKPIHSTRKLPTDIRIAGGNDNTAVGYISPSTPDEMVVKHAYRVNAERFEKFKQAVGMFNGTHNFHNYTISRAYSDPSAKRHMMEVKVNDPTYFQGTEWLSVKLRGQSFMLHQIRKMMSMAMLVTRSNTPLSLIDRSFEATKINIPKAPALGLLLDQPLFDHYNQRVEGRDDREPIGFDKFQSQINEFKREWIYSKIFETDRAGQVSLAEQSLSSIDDLSHAVAGVAHVAKPYEEGVVMLRKMRLFKEPIDKELAEAKAKLEMWTNEKKSIESWTLNWFMFWITCEVKAETQRCIEGIKKSNVLVAEAQKKVDEEDEKIREAEASHEKNAVDNRTLQKYREELTELLDSIFNESDFSTEKALKEQVDGVRADLEKIQKEDETIEKVMELIKKADTSLLEAVVELRQSNDNKTLSEGQVYFPQEAFDALKTAREIYPELPAIQSPVEYNKKPDDTGTYYSPMQRYLWDVRQSLKDLMHWCDMRLLDHMDDEAEGIVALGAKIDEYNLERRRLVREVILSA
ncbi:pseudouridine synthase [Fennellomyces sp. T-0311]|nr:pseudouridine synthase [Fennellomyces sp. T-0311]